MIRLQERPYWLDASQCSWVTETLRCMTVEEKVGQLFCVMGQDYQPEKLLEMVRGGKVGGILFRPEPRDSILNRFAPLDAVSRIPLLKAANLEEGGAGGAEDPCHPPDPRPF